jgi:rubredoxin
MVVALLALPALGWPSLFTDCSIFPDFGQPQKRPVNHAPMTLLCEPHPPASFEWCSRNCIVQGVHSHARVNCSAEICDCQERCMGTADVCTGSGASQDPTHRSLPNALAARSGNTSLLVDGAPPQHYAAGTTYTLTVVPRATGTNTSSTWYLLDAGVGTLAFIEGGGARSWRTQCNATRASFESAGGAVAVRWSAPPQAHGALVLRVAAATAMGNLSVNAAILNATKRAPLPAGSIGYACTTSGASAHSPWPLRQCQSVPPGTVGAANLSACESECFTGSGTYRCTRCAHVYDAAQHGGVPFEALPDTWACPVCGAPKSAYAKEIGDGGEVRWLHFEDVQDEQ